MRMRNPKNMDEILNSCNYFLTEDLFNNNNDIIIIITNIIINIYFLKV